MSAPAWVTDGDAVPSTVVDRYAQDGWTGVEGFGLPGQPWDLADRSWFRWGRVEGDGTEAVVLAAVRGVGVLVACPDADQRTELVEDLARLGPVEVELVGPDPLRDLDDDQRGLLAELARGASVQEAAERLLVSKRTAERRLATARKVLGVRTTAEAIVLAQTSMSMEDGDHG